MTAGMQQTKPVGLGDVVRLVSGGPHMTIIAFRAPGEDDKYPAVMCGWFDERSSAYYRDTFYLFSLVAAAPPHARVQWSSATD